LAEIGIVANRRRRAGLRDAAEGVRIEAVLDAAQRLDQPGVGERIADARPTNARDFDIVYTTSRFG